MMLLCRWAPSGAAEPAAATRLVPVDDGTPLGVRIEEAVVEDDAGEATRITARTSARTCAPWDQGSELTPRSQKSPFSA